MRDWRLHAADILTAIAHIEEYLGSMSAADLASDQKTLDAIVRNFEVIGIAVAQLPVELKAN